MKLTPRRLAELKKLGFYVEEQDTDSMVLAPVPKKKKVKKTAAPAKTPYIGPKKWKFAVVRDEFGFIESIDATEIPTRTT